MTTEHFSSTRFSRSPECIEFDGGRLADHTHPRAVAFSLVNDKVLTTARGTHPFIFGALTTLALPEQRSNNEIARGSLARVGVEAFLRDYGVRVWPAPLTEADLQWFRERHTGDLGALRERTRSGRVWSEVAHRGGRVTVFSFWVNADRVDDSALRLLCARFALDGSSSSCPIYVEYLDSLQPVLLSLQKR